MATACLDLSSGQVVTWPYPTQPWERNASLLEAMYQVWRVVHLWNKPRTRPGPTGPVTNWTSRDLDFYDFLTDEEYELK